MGILQEAWHIFQGEKLSADKEAADQFVPRFRKLVEANSFSHQIP